MVRFPYFFRGHPFVSLSLDTGSNIRASVNSNPIRIVFSVTLSAHGVSFRVWTSLQFLAHSTRVELGLEQHKISNMHTIFLPVTFHAMNERGGGSLSLAQYTLTRPRTH